MKNEHIGSPEFPMAGRVDSAASGVRLVQFVIERWCPQIYGGCDMVECTPSFPFPVWVHWPPEVGNFDKCDSARAYLITNESYRDALKHFQIKLTKRSAHGRHLCDHNGQVIE